VSSDVIDTPVRGLVVFAGRAVLHFELTNEAAAIVVEHGYDSGNVIGIWIMNAELIRRCVRAMTETGEGSLVPLCRKIVDQ